MWEKFLAEHWSSQSHCVNHEETTAVHSACNILKCLNPWGKDSAITQETYFEGSI